MRKCQLMWQITPVAGSRDERKAARTWSGCRFLKDVLPLPYRK